MFEFLVFSLRISLLGFDPISLTFKCDFETIACTLRISNHATEFKLRTYIHILTLLYINIHVL